MLGIVAGYGPRWLDSVLLLVMDAVRSFPAVIMAMAVVALTGPSLGIVLVIIIVTSIPSYARLARTSTLALKNAEFIAAERSLGATPWRIMLRHVMPNIAGPLLILGAMDVPVVVTVEAGLSFLGLGVLPPTASWGTILNEGYLVIRDTPWPVIAGGVPLGPDHPGLHLSRRILARRARSRACGAADDQPARGARPVGRLHDRARARSTRCAMSTSTCRAAASSASSARAGRARAR